MHRRGMDANIKLGRGGIREIEFIGQALQLVHGGRDPALQVRPILEVLKRLGERSLLPEEAVEALSSAYGFLRLTENRIQAWRDEQTHLLPADEAGRRRLARSMGFEAWPAFERELEAHRARVDHHFQQVFAVEAEDARPLVRAWLGDGDPDELQALLAEAGFHETGAVLAQLEGFRQSSACRSLTAGAREKLDRLMPRLLEAIGHCRWPETALERLLRLLQAIVRRTAYLDLLLENPQVVEHLVRLAAESLWVVEQLIRYPVLLDELLPFRHHRREAAGGQRCLLCPAGAAYRAPALHPHALGDSLRSGHAPAAQRQLRAPGELPGGIREVAARKCLLGFNS